jgi:hypothetical protein
MVRRLRRRRCHRPVHVARYSSETNYIFQILVVPSDQTPTFHALLVPVSPAQGSRKAKNFTLKFVSSTLDCPFAFAIIYLPEGVDIEQQLLRAGPRDNPVSFYEPAQNVMMVG